MGEHLVYLSRTVPRDRYPWPEVGGDLRLLRVREGTERTLAPDARPTGWGHRAAVWRNDREVIYIDGDGRTRLVNVDTGEASILLDEPHPKLAWLMDATLTRAVDGSPTFTTYDRGAGSVAPARRLPGARRYVYFPMVSRDQRLLVFGASSGDHVLFSAGP